MCFSRGSVETSGGAASAPRSAAAGVPMTHLRFPTPFAGANRIRFEGLRRTALSALWALPCRWTVPRRPGLELTKTSGVSLDGPALLWRTEMAMGKVAWKIMGTGGAILAGIIATKVIDAVWARAGQDEINPKNPHAPLAQGRRLRGDHRAGGGCREDHRHPQGRGVLREVLRAPAGRGARDGPGLTTAVDSRRHAVAPAGTRRVLSSRRVRRRSPAVRRRSPSRP